MKNPRLITYSMMSLICLVIILTFTVRWYAKQTTLPPGMTVGGWQVGGMELQGMQQNWAAQLARLAALPVQLQTDQSAVGSQTLPLGELGLRVDDSQLQAVLQRLFTGTVAERAKQRWLLRDAHITVPLQIDAAVLDSRVRKQWRALYSRAPVPAKRVITPSDEITYEAEHFEPRIDTAALAARLEATLQPISRQLMQRSSASSPDKQQLLTMRIALPVVAEKPTTTVASLQAQGIERKIVEYSTPIIDAAPGRLHNITAPATVIHDMLLKPGEIFDYAKVVKQAEQQFGFQESKVILNGKLVNGIGGGICQVSTTLYNAALLSGLEIIERKNHSLMISYAPLGQDATFSSDGINFRFRNNTGSYLLIRTETQNNKFTVKLFGQLPEGISYEVKSNILETIPAPTEYVSNPNLSPTERVKVVDGKEGYIVETYRITKRNGATIATDKISKDKYAPQPTIYAVKESATPPQTSPAPIKIEDGVMGPIFR
ncbi:hypothetical protein E0485_12895 [Paenibacillus albiflavus]|uniref:G5 domain-containing protein n=1 Tax=Paenibacillus albiflavus TaxID=2545760 RepID=A0A4R4EB40_9BACL|nr:VanW family protein [Paenibacillus albiflavus]TCZ76869.1 hypothetical protein E0485_12895 [Paenibacillus albiflavus]